METWFQRWTLLPRPAGGSRRARIKLHAGAAALWHARNNYMACSWGACVHGVHACCACMGQSVGPKSILPEVDGQRLANCMDDLDCMPWSSVAFTGENCVDAGTPAAGALGAVFPFACSHDCCRLTD